MNWHGFRVVDGKDTQHPWFRHHDGPALTARCRVDGTSSEIEVVVPMTKLDLFRWSIADPTFLDSLADRLEEARLKLTMRDEPAVLV